MSLSILNNISSLQAENSLNVTQANLNKTLQQLSTGQRINSGADDAAGLAIANGLEANITALTQSAQNATDGVGMFQVADGALSQITNLLNRSVTLATEASTGTVDSSQQGALDAEYQQIQQEITQIGANTNYNGSAVFSPAALTVFLSDGVSNSPISATTGNVSASSLLGGAATATMAVNAVPTAADQVTIGGTTYKFVAALTGAANEVLIDATAGDTAAQHLSNTLSNLAAAVNGGAGLGTVYGNGTVANADATASASGSEVTFEATAAGLGIIAGGGTIASKVVAGGSGSEAFTNGATFSGGGTSDLQNAPNAKAALTAINSAIASVASIRGQLGAVINRLQAASTVMTNESQNLTSSESGIMSADIGQVTANMSQYTILEQTGIAALQQSNQMQQMVLKLLQ